VKQIVSTKSVLLAFASILSVIIFVRPSFADLSIKFIESAPKDRFEIKNIGPCAIPSGQMSINMENSKGGLIFDITAGGAGVEVFQKFEAVTGANKFELISPIKDGDNIISFKTSSLEPNAMISFTIDVDDTLVNSALGQIRVSGNEISGSSLEYKNMHSEENLTAIFETNQALIEFNCSDKI